ncbi:hypothetical protein D3C76_1583510 [compost metagenome]
MNLKVPSIMSKPLKSSIGPSTRKERSEPAENECMKAEATKASEVEHRDKTNANPIMNK